MTYERKNGDVFCTVGTLGEHDKNNFHPANHGRPWTSEMVTALVSYFRRGTTPQNIALHTGRKLEAVVLKLISLGQLKYDPSRMHYVVVNQPREQDNQSEVTEMNNTEAAIIETIVMIQGNDASKMSDEQIFRLIAKLEQEAETLNKVQNKPKKLTAKIEAIKADIQKLVEYVDSRE